MRVFSDFRKKKSPPPSEGKGAEQLAASLAKTALASNKGGYLSYLLALFKGTSPYALWQRARTAFAPAIFLSRLFRILRWTFRIIEASALLLVSAAILLLAAPLFLLFLLSLVSAATVSTRRADRRIPSHFENKRVLILFSGTVKGGAPRLPRHLPAAYTVLLVVPLLSTVQVGEGRFSPLSAAHVLSDGTILVREYYYFHLARRHLSRAAFCARVY